MSDLVGLGRPEHNVRIQVEVRPRVHKLWHRIGVVDCGVVDCGHRAIAIATFRFKMPSFPSGSTIHLD
ncbi:MAG: hypothetical protein ACJAR2_000546 [Ilumatobacter sp.]